MAQVKIYALKSELEKTREKLSSAIHGCLVKCFGLPENKRFHRFILLEKENFLFPEDRSEKYTIIELSIFSGRSEETKKLLIRRLFEEIEKETGIKNQDVEITLFETPQMNWGIRGKTGDELQLGYKVNC